MRSFSTLRTIISVTFLNLFIYLDTLQDSMPTEPKMLLNGERKMGPLSTENS